MRSYGDPVEVRRSESGGPEQFLWHGRLWKVRAVLARWVETEPWWQQVRPGEPSAAMVAASVGASRAAQVGGASVPEAGTAAPRVDLSDLAERELWRVEAGRGPDAASGQWGVFDLSCASADGRWQLIGCAD